MFNYLKIDEICKNKELARALENRLFQNPELFYRIVMKENLEYEPANTMELEGKAWVLLWIGKPKESYVLFKELYNTYKGQEKEETKLILDQWEETGKIAKLIWENMRKEARGEV